MRWVRRGGERVRAPAGRRDAAASPTAADSHLRHTHAFGIGSERSAEAIEKARQRLQWVEWLIAATAPSVTV